MSALSYNLVTGAGGSIGSKICERLENVVAVGHGENSLYQLQKDCIKIIADIRDYQRMEEIIHAYNPVAIYHAAAHKHVSFCEQNVNDAISNNITGTQNVVRLARKYNVPKFVLISTDKAVEPISVMGMTKALAEKIVLSAGYTVVRLGNVIWSRGSVLPYWKKLLKTDDIVPVTHPDVMRYFITAEQAAKFVVEASGNRVIVPKMKEYNMTDIAYSMGAKSVEYYGLQPGEKLREKLWWEHEEK